MGLQILILHSGVSLHCRHLHNYRNRYKLMADVGRARYRTQVGGRKMRLEALRDVPRRTRF
jgi:hypothetical protein